ELANYLRRIRDVWKYISTDEDGSQVQLDTTTVLILQGRCPGLAEADYLLIKDKRRDILPGISKLLARDKLWHRICSYKYNIPSLHTFLEDTKYLEPCARILKELLPPVSGMSIREAFKSVHNSQKNVEAQLTENSSKTVNFQSSEMSFGFAYLQLWLFAMRHFPVLTGHCPRKDCAGVKPWTSRGDSLLRSRLFMLAKSSGFESIQSKVQTVDEAYSRESEKLISHFFPPSMYNLAAIQKDQLARNIVRVIKQCQTGLMRKDFVGQSQRTTDTEADSCGQDITNRCGVPFVSSFERDQPSIFMDHLLQQSEIEQGRYLTSFTIVHDMVHSFFCGSEAGQEWSNANKTDNSSFEPREVASDLNQAVHSTVVETPPYVQPFESSRPLQVDKRPRLALTDDVTTSKKAKRKATPEHVETMEWPVIASNIKEVDGGTVHGGIIEKEAVGRLVEIEACSRGPDGPKPTNLTVFEQISDNTYLQRELSREDREGIAQLVQQGYSCWTYDPSKGPQFAIATQFPDFNAVIKVRSSSAERVGAELREIDL
ncbi:MAG: hypothetical protein L6R37_008264, partial [Teloschistes peruensis]